MRILMCTSELAPQNSGGLGVAARAIGEALARAGHSVVCLVPQTTPPTFKTEPPPHTRTCTMRIVPVPLDPLADTPTGSYPTTPTPSYGSQPEEQACNLARAIRTFAEFAAVAAQAAPFHRVYCHDWMTAPAGLRIASTLKIPFVWHVHSLETDRNGVAPAAWIRNIESRAAAKADALIAVSRQTAAKIHREFAIPQENIHVVHNGVDTKRFRPLSRLDHPNRSPCVLFLGRMVRQKGPEIFVRAAARLHTRCPEVRFVMAGAGPRLVPARKLAARLRIENRMQFPGAIPHSEIPSLLGGVAALAVPSIAEPFGLVALEAAASAVPVVLTEACGVREVLPAAPVAPVFNARALAEALARILRNSRERRRQITANLDAARDHAWTTAARRIHAILAAP